jgi:hypothetical protein
MNVDISSAYDEDYVDSIMKDNDDTPKRPKGFNGSRYRKRTFDKQRKARQRDRERLSKRLEDDDNGSM